MNEEFAKGYENYFGEKKMEKKEEKNNKVIIAGKPFEVYNEIILETLQNNDSVELSVEEKYADKALLILQMWRNIGILPANDDQRIRFIPEKKDIDLRDGKIYKDRIVYKIEIIKIPELMFFTEDK